MEGNVVPVALRSANPGDRDRLAVLLAEYLYEFDGRTEPYPYLDSYWQEESRLPFVITDDDEIVGLCLIRRMNDWWSIAEFFVVPGARRGGVGRRAVAALTEAAMSDGATCLEAKVHHSNAQALPFWRSVGFVVVSDDEVTITRRPLSRRTLVLIGPLGAGKSTVAELLARRLDRPRIGMDDRRWTYYAELGYDAAAAQSAFDAGRTPRERLAFTMPFEAHAVERTLAANKGAVVDFGASNSCIDDDELLNRVEVALADCDVVLLLPSTDMATSERVLIERLRPIVEAKGEEITPVLLELNRYFMAHPVSRRLADTIVYTDGRAVDDVCDQVIGWVVNQRLDG
jgi:predicted acetyltransferase